MNPKTIRPIGITLLAIAHVWNGFLGIIVFPIIGFSFWEDFLRWLTGTYHWPQTLARFSGSLFFIAVWVIYLGYGWVGIGLWKLRFWAWKCEVGFLLCFGSVSIAASIFLVKPVIFASVFVIWYSLGLGWIVWYLFRPRVRFAFEMGQLDQAPASYPAQPPEMSKRGKILIGVSLVMTAFVFIFSLLVCIESMVRQSDVYKLALYEAAGSPCVTSKVGNPFEVGWMATGGMSESDQTGSANWEIPIRGSKGKATLIVEAEKNGGQWKLNKFSLAQAGESSISLLPTSHCQ